MAADHRMELRQALEEIDNATRENVARSQEIQTRVEWLMESLDGGVDIIEIAEKEPKPKIVEMITTNIETLQSIGSQLRQAEARALRAEGATMEWIADLFGVTRQRISALLRQGS
jgi:succinyl-CoA synthetase beta subunit